MSSKKTTESLIDETHQKIATFQGAGGLPSTPPKQYNKSGKKSSPTSVMHPDVMDGQEAVTSATKTLLANLLKGVKEESKYVLSLKMALDGSHVDDSNDFREAVPGFQYIPAHLPAKSNESFSFADVLEE